MLNRIHIVALLIASTFLCLSLSNIQGQFDGRDKGTLVPNVDDEAWMKFINRQVAEEALGHKPPTKSNIKWKEYWRSWFDEIRMSRGMPWRDSRFKTKEEMIAYIKNQRKAHGLPSYN